MRSLQLRERARERETERQREKERETERGERGRNIERSSNVKVDG
jgi:hypothetical protein